MDYAKTGGRLDLAHGPSPASPCLVYLLYRQNNFIRQRKDTKCNRPSWPGIWRQSDPKVMASVLFNKAELILTSDRFAGEWPEGSGTLSQSLTMSPLCWWHCCPKHCPRTDGETIIQDFCLDAGRKEQHAFKMFTPNPVLSASPSVLPRSALV